MRRFLFTPIIITLGMLYVLTGVVAPAFADTSITGASNCPTGSGGNPSGSKSFPASAGSAQSIHDYLYQVESCASACFDENVNLQVSVSLTPSVTLTTTATNKCSDPKGANAAQSKRGCSAGMTQPQITMRVPDVSFLMTTYMKAQTIGPKSRCYGAVSGAVSSLLGNGISSLSPSSVQSTFDKLNALSPQAPAPANPSTTIAGNDALVAALTGSGLSQGQATKIVSDPTSAQALVNAYATGNKDTIQDTVQDAADKAGLNLNNAIYDNIAQLSSDQVQQDKTTLTPYADQSGTYPGAPSTFTNSGNSPSGNSLTDGNVCGYSGIAGRMMGSETRCNTLNAPAGQAAQGPLQYQCATWQSYTVASGHSDWSDCSNRYDVNKVVAVTNDYYQNVWAPKYAAQCTGAGYSIDSCAYSYHWLGSGDYSKLVQGLGNGTIDPNASFTSLCGTVLLAGDCSQNPGLVYGNSRSHSQPYTVSGDFQQLDQLLQVSSNIAPAPATGGVPTGSFASPFSIGGQSSNTGNVSSYIPYLTTSPFANVTPVGTSLIVGGASYTPSYVAQPTQIPTTPTAQEVVPSAQFTAQPQTASTSTPITLTWSSYGMSPSAPCIVSQNSAQITSSYAGAMTVTATSTGQIIFSFSCTGANGSPILRYASVIVQ